VAGPGRPRGRCRKAGNDELLVLIRRLVNERPSYGYRRISGLLSRQQRAEGQA
jgi:hypothetical protein